MRLPDSELISSTAAQTSVSKGWEASLTLGFVAKGDKTVLANRQHYGPLRVQRPFYPEGGVCHVYLLHPPGGVVAGDRLNLNISAAAQSAALVTTPAAGKFYRSAGEQARQSVHLSVATAACLEWLPQETIIYDGAQVVNDTCLELAHGARFIGWDMLILGRPAANEGFSYGEVDLSWRILRANQLLYCERLRLDAQAFNARWGLNGLAACGTLFAYPATIHHLELVRGVIAESAGRGVTLIEDLLICRALDARVDRLREFMQQVWVAIRQDIVQRECCIPRIWAT